MLKNIITTALRNFVKHKAFSAINLVGLSISMSLSMLMIMLIKEQFSFDKFHPESHRIYRVNTIVQHPDWGNIDFATAPLPVAEALNEAYTLTDQTVRVNRQFRADALHSGVNVPLHGLFVDQSFFNVFNFPFATGDASTALVAPRSLVLTATAAKRIFGKIDPVGKSIAMGKYGEFVISGVLQELPGKTHFEFEALASMNTLVSLEQSKVVPNASDDFSAYYDNYVYLRLREGADPTEVEKALAEINKKHGVGLKSDGREIAYQFYLQPLNEITPGREISGQMGNGMSMSIILFLGVLTMIILVMSVFNFTNLTIAKSLSRAREIGVRKVAGAKRHQVFFQFIGEAIVFAMIALGFSFVLLEFLKMAFQGLSFNQYFSLDLQQDIPSALLFLLFAVLVGFLAGILPATYMSAFQPVRVLKDIQNVALYGRLTFRKVLVVVQFTLSVVFVILVFVVYRQVNFMLTADYGMNHKNIINLTLQDVPYGRISSDLESIPGVVRVGGVSHRLGTWDDSSGDYKRGHTEPMRVSHFMVDNKFIENIDLKFIAGKNFSDGHSNSERDVILNETAVESFGFKSASDAVGEALHWNDTIMVQIVGVVKDFHYRPLNNRIGPLVLRSASDEFSYASVRYEPEAEQRVMAAIATAYKKHDPMHPAIAEKMESQIDEAYRQTGIKDMVYIVGYVAIIAVSLACLGMLGMAMYASQIRVKEMVIRKVMGASVADVVLLLSKSFIILIAIAVFLGVPAGIALGEVFLSDFAYRITISPILITGSIALILALGFGIVWSQTIRVATSNPVKWIKNE